MSSVDDSQYSFLILPFILIDTRSFKINFNLHSLTLMLTDFDDIFTLIEYIHQI